MGLPANPFVEFERIHGRKVATFTAGYVVVSGVYVGTLAYFVLTIPEMFPSWFIWYTIAQPLLFGLLFVLFRRAFSRTVKFARTLGPRLKGAGIHLFSGITYVFDDGLTLMWTSGGPQFLLYGSSSGNRATPSLEQIRLLRRGFLRMVQLLRVDRRHGPEPLRDRLEALRDEMGSRFALLYVFAPRSSAPADPTRATWVATILFGRSKASLEAERVLRMMDRTASLLEDAVKTARTQGSTLPAPL